MQHNQKKIRIIIVSLIILVIIALIYWLKPNDNTESTHLNSESTATSMGSDGKVALAAQGSVQGSFASASQQDIEINCQLSMDASNRLIVNEATKNCFEFFITQYGEKEIQQIKTDFIQYSQSTYKEPLLSQLTDLWSRYIQYREQLGNIQPPTGDKESANYYKAIFSNMKSLRQKLFSNYEIEGLFGIEDAYNDYTLARMAVMENKQLSEAEKAKKLQDLFNDLPVDWKENLKQLSQLEDLRALTSEIKARGGSAEEIRQMRMNLVGPEATQRLETLDGQRSDWKNRVNGYLENRESILKSNMSETAKQSAIQDLRNQQFKNPQEQLRLETFESVHDKGEKLPYGD